MKLTSHASVPAPRSAVFAALVNPEVLQRSIPGCEALVATGPGTYEAQLRIGVAGLKGSYKGKVTLTDERPPDSFSLSFDGKGGPGFVRGTALVRLSLEGKSISEGLTTTVVETGRSSLPARSTRSIIGIPPTR